MLILSEYRSKDFRGDESNSHDTSKLCQKYKINEIIYTIILDGKESAGKYSIIEVEFPTKKEIPLHKHTKENIIIYIIEGEFLIRSGKENINGIPGKVLRLEKNIEHSYKKIGNDKGKILVLFEPAGFENYFRDLNSVSSSSSASSISDDLNILDKDDDRIRFASFRKNLWMDFL